MGRQRGFTIIEVVLFLAISGLLFMMAYGATNGTIKNVRNDDSRNSLVSFIQKQYTTVLTNDIPRPLRPGESVTCSSGLGTDITVQSGVKRVGASQTCLLIGLQLRIVQNADGDQIKTYPILAFAAAAPGNLPTEALKNANPVVWDVQKSAGDANTQDRAITTYDLEWKTKISDAKIGMKNSEEAAANRSFDAITFIKNPLTDSVDVLYSRGTNFNILPILVSNENSIPSQRRNTPAIICLKYSDSNAANRRDAILIHGSDGAQGIAITDISGVEGRQGDSHLEDVYTGGLSCAN